MVASVSGPWTNVRLWQQLQCNCERKKKCVEAPWFQKERRELPEIAKHILLPIAHLRWGWGNGWRKNLCLSDILFLKFELAAHTHRHTHTQTIPTYNKCPDTRLLDCELWEGRMHLPPLMLLLTLEVSAAQMNCRPTILMVSQLFLKVLSRDCQHCMC